MLSKFDGREDKKKPIPLLTEEYVCSLMRGEVPGSQINARYIIQREVSAKPKPTQIAKLCMLLFNS